MLKKKRMAVWFLTFVVQGLLLGQIVSARMLYDNFSGAHVDDQKWMNQWTDYTEMVREVAGGKLVSRIGNTPNRLIARNHLQFQNQSTIHTIRCDVTINETILDSGDTPEAFARVNGRFYNTRVSGGSTGDVWAGVHIGNRGNGLEAWWEVTEILDDNSTTFNELGSGTLAVPGLTNGVSYTVELAYDGSNGFTFTVAGVNATFNSGPARQRDPFNAFKGLTTGAYGFDGAAGNGYVAATIDNVYINGQTSAYDTFDSELDDSRWASFESVMEIESGRLRFHRQGFDQRSQVTAYLSDADATYVEARVRINSDSEVSTGARGIFRIQGYFYNESRGEGSGLAYNGFEGDVFADMRLQLHDDGSMEAAAYVGRSDSSDESLWADLEWHPFSTPIHTDTDYTISLQYTDSKLIFKCDSETFVYPVDTAQYPPYGEHRGLRSRVYLDDGEYGYIKTLVDEVYVDGAGSTPATMMLLLDSD
ncbi:hypothetical protein DSCA_53020 [Desulfosarcina alkanivorans]|uniref:Uncharacterized protein n=1 Tax=Desulfosarcina alkanivorans TaxID=571177 RepID=A0A5K7YNM3_9BACT|nr:hypothetical protein [Desulfosarcina alkanivorans]BBO71372.1 hypothetical protein DSCA_53020 [Desulfosarcina alkanivorans]